MVDLGDRCYSMCQNSVSVITYMYFMWLDRHFGVRSGEKKKKKRGYISQQPLPVFLE